MKQHIVQAGDCVSSIAEYYGFDWERLWNLPENATVKQSRLP
ncbi:MAG: LysM peptidoglycan-binding domain-containing protein, partial [Bryobacteraceae bacterium]|nr:LysM peptidoglycan-binding domain-containing protein [Bryobacteraceae bacterium]